MGLPELPKKPKGGKLGKDHTFRADQQELRIGKALKEVGIHRNVGSGAIMGKKGDLQGNKFETLTIECKTVVEAKSISIKLEYLDKIVKEARNRRNVPALVFGFEAAERPTPKDWVAIPLEKFKELLQQAGWDANITGGNASKAGNSS